MLRGNGFPGGSPKFSGWASCPGTSEKPRGQPRPRRRRLAPRAHSRFQERLWLLPPVQTRGQYIHPTGTMQAASWSPVSPGACPGAGRLQGLCLAGRRAPGSSVLCLWAAAPVGSPDAAMAAGVPAVVVGPYPVLCPPCLPELGPSCRGRGRSGVTLLGGPWSVPPAAQEPLGHSGHPGLWGTLLYSGHQGWPSEPAVARGGMGSRLSDFTFTFPLVTFLHGRRKWQPTPVFLPGESQGWGSLVRARTRSPSPRAWRPDSPGAAREYSVVSAHHCVVERAPSGH